MKRKKHGNAVRSKEKQRKARKRREKQGEARKDKGLAENNRKKVCAKLPC